MTDETPSDVAGEDQPPAAGQPTAATPPTPEPPREITLEEWIAAGQSCCGADHDDD